MDIQGCEFRFEDKNITVERNLRPVAQLADKTMGFE